MCSLLLIKLKSNYCSNTISPVLGLICTFLYFLKISINSLVLRPIPSPANAPTNPAIIKDILIVLAAAVPAVKESTDTPNDAPPVNGAATIPARIPAPASTPLPIPIPFFIFFEKLLF